MKEWVNQSIYILSNLKDFDVEREFIKDHVEQEVKNQLSRVGIDVEFIDLRQGLKSDGNKELDILKVYENEINTCHPFMLILLGDCYGEVPNKDNLEEKSLLEKEIEFGLFERNAKNSFVYVREALPYVLMLPDTAKQYSDEYINKDHYDRLIQLKERIENLVPKDHRRTYKVKWNFTTNSIYSNSLRKFGEQMVDDLVNEIKKFVNSERSQHINPEEKIIDTFIAYKTKISIANESIVKQFVSFAIDENPQIRLNQILGHENTGKSTLMSEIKKDLSSKNCLLLYHFAGITENSNRMERMIDRFLTQLSHFLEVTVDLKKDFGTKIKEFYSLINKASLKKRVVILIDGMDSFETTLCSVIPPYIGENIRFIISTKKAIHHPEQSKSYTLDYLNQEDIFRISKQIYRKYDLPIHLKELDQLKKYQFTPYHLLTLLEEVIHYEYKELNATLGELYQVMIDRAIKHLGKDYTLTLLKFLTTSRYGLRLMDLKALCPPLIGRIWKDIDFAYFKAFFQTQLYELGDEGRINLHPSFKAYVSHQFLKDSVEIKTIHEKIALYLETLPSLHPLRLKESMVHYYHANLKMKAVKFIDSYENGNLMKTLESFLLDQQAFEWFIDLLKMEMTIKECYHLNRIYKEIALMLQYKLEPNKIIYLLKAVIEQEKQLLKKEPTNLSYIRNLSISYIKLGELYLGMGNSTIALTHYENSLNLIKESINFNYFKVDLMETYSKLGDLYAMKGKNDEAYDYYERGLEINEKLVLLEPDHIEYNEYLFKNYQHLGLFYMSKGEDEKAYDLFLRSLDRIEDLIELNPKQTHYKRDHYDTYLNLGKSCMNTHRIKDAIDYFKKAVRLSETLNEGAIECADLYDTLGDIYINKGDRDLAIEMYKKSIQVIEPFIALDKHNLSYKRKLCLYCEKLGSLYESNFEYLKAKNLIEISCQYKEELSQYETIESLPNTYHQMGFLYLNMGNKEEALKYFKKCHALKPNLFENNIALGDLYQEHNDYVQALAYYESCEMLEPLTQVVCLKKIGDTYFLMHQGDKAKVAYEKCIASFNECIDEQKTEEIIFKGSDCYGKLADLLSEEKDDVKAIRYYEKAIELNDTISNHKRYQGINFHKLGKGYLKLEEFDKALNAFQKGLTYKNNLKEEEVIDTLMCLGQLELRINHFEEAYQYYLQAKHLDEKEQYLLELLLQLGKLAYLLKHVDEAKMYYTEGLEVMERVGKKDVEEYSLLLEQIGDLCLELNQLLFAVSYYEKSLTNYKQESLIENFYTVCMKLIQCYECLNQKNKVLEYYLLAQHYLEAHGDLVHLIHVYKKIAQFYKKQDEIEPMIAYYEKFIHLAIKQIEEKPNQYPYLEDLASIYCFISDQLLKNGDEKKAIFYLHKCKETLEQLIYKTVDDPEYKVSLAICYRKLGDYSFKSQNDDITQAFYQNSLVIYQELVLLYPNELTYKVGLAQNTEKVGNTYIKKSQLEEAIKQYEKCVDIFKLITAISPHEKTYQSELLRLTAKLNSYYKEQAILYNKVEYYDKSIKIDEYLVERVPTNKTFLEDLYLNYRRYGEFNEKNQDFINATNFYQKGFTIIESLLESDENVQYYSDASLILEKLYYLYRDQSPKQSITFLEKSIMMDEKMDSYNRFKKSVEQAGYYIKNDLINQAKEIYKNRIKEIKKILKKDESLELKDYLSQMYLNVAKIMDDCNQNKKAIRYFKKCLKLLKGLSQIDTKYKNTYKSLKNELKNKKR